MLLFPVQPERGRRGLEMPSLSQYCELPEESAGYYRTAQLFSHRVAILIVIPEVSSGISKSGDCQTMIK